MPAPVLDLALRPATADDAPFFAALEARPENRALIFGQTAAEHRRQLADPDLRYLLGLAGETPVAAVILAGFVHRSLSRSILLQRVAVAEPGRGQGGAALAAVMAYVFDACAMRRLWLEVFADNGRAVRAYERAGFVREGRLREAYWRRDDTFADAYVMAVLEREWRAARAAPAGG